MSQRTHFVSVMGTIGSGKSTAVNLLAKHFQWQVLEENFGENAFLPRFYTDPNRWAFHSQTFFLMEKISQLLPVEGMLSLGSVVQDVPIYQDVYGYARTQYALGNMEESEWRLYHKIFKEFEGYMLKPDLIIYLATSLPIVQERIRKRGRSYELEIPDTYLETLRRNNEAWLDSDHGIPIVRIDTDFLNIVRSKKDQSEFLRQVEKGLRKL